MSMGDGVRRNVAQISHEELHRLQDAFIELNRRLYPGNRDEIPAGGVSHWFKQDEVHQSTHVHGGPAFLPWHRELCHRFEKMLQEVDASVALHYWDGTTDPRECPDGHGGIVNLFSNGLNGFMGNAIGIAGSPLDSPYDPMAIIDRD